MPHTALIDLTNGRIEVEETSPSLLERWLGGRGLATALFCDLVDSSIKPFDAENVLIFSTGLFNGTSWPASARYHVTFKSPATEAYGHANAGGYFGPELRRAGFDALVFTGKAPSPTIARVKDTDIELFPAGDLWGRTTSEVDKILRQGSAGRVVAIGPAGENLVRIAAIMSDNGRAAARGGPGAVMGSKNLKAVHVIASSRRSLTPPSFRLITKEMSKYILKHPRPKRLMDESTLFLMRAKQGIGDLPAKNHQLAQVPFIDKVDSKAFSAYWTARTGCASCPIRCSRRTELEDGDNIISFEGPEFESSDAFGPLCWNPDPELVIKANHLCNEYGMDTISTGVTIGFAMECHQRGLLNDEKLSLEWGDAETILGLIERIAFRQGLGSILADGVYRAAQEIGNGAEQYAMHVKGLELPRQEPRTAKAMGLGHMTSNRGADHLYGFATMDVVGAWDIARELFPEETLTQLMDTHDETYKADIVVFGENFNAFADCLGVCRFSTTQNYIIMPDQLADGVRAIGFDLTADELLVLGERIVNLERLFNFRQGLDRRNDCLPKRFTEEPLDTYLITIDEETGETKLSDEPLVTGSLVNCDIMLDRYYQLRGWDKNGVPTSSTLSRLGLA